MKTKITKIICILLCTVLISATALFSGCEKTAENTALPPVASSSDSSVSDSSVSEDIVSEDIVSDEFVSDSSAYICEHSFRFSDDDTKTCNNCDFSVSPIIEISESFITDDTTYINTGHVILVVEKGIFVPYNLIEKIENAFLAMESSAGITFKNNYLTVFVETNPINENDESEFSGGAYAYSDGSGIIYIASGDMPLGNSYTFLHEASHALLHSHTVKFSSQVTSEGFAQYNTYKCLKNLEADAPEIAYYYSTSTSASSDMSISDPSSVYTESIEYWMENGFPIEYSGNGSYSVGFRFMAYLDNVYGNFSSWIDLCNNAETGFDHLLTVEQEVEILKAAYGDDVFDNFYPWLKKNEHLFEYYITDSPDYDLTKADYVELYPFFMGFDCATTLVNGAYISYDNLTVNLLETRKYLSEYKNRDLSSLKLRFIWGDGEQTIELFDLKGNSMGTVTEESEIPLKDVGKIVFVGKGTVRNVEIVGYMDYNGNMK